MLLKAWYKITGPINIKNKVNASFLNPDVNLFFFN
tara:strand:+ start:373 stop:477 length:105 start_codon:yes stop_codon:yes gene_type:complete